MKVKDYLEVTEGIKVVNICTLEPADWSYGMEQRILAGHADAKSILKYSNKTITSVELVKGEDGITADIYIK